MGKSRPPDGKGSGLARGYDGPPRGGGGISKVTWRGIKQSLATLSRTLSSQIGATPPNGPPRGGPPSGPMKWGPLNGHNGPLGGGFP
jgi:hypothetical protein